MTRATRLVSLTGVAAAAVVLALASAAYRAPRLVRIAYDRITAPHEGSEARDLGFSLGWYTQRAMLGAARGIPRNATYTIVVGNAPPPTAIEKEGVPGLLRYWLLPRRYTADPRRAQWVIAFHHSSETIGLPYRKEIPLAPYVNMFRVTR